MPSQEPVDHLFPLLSNIRIVLINTQHPGNIGGTARAMKNMGLSQLVLVNPQDFPADKAIWRAGHALDVLDNTRVVSSLGEAIADCGLVLGTSARERSIPWPLHTAREAGEHAVSEAPTHPVAILFGREDRGLTNEELQHCHAHLHIPANPVYSALNLATAVQVVAYEVRQAALAATDTAGKPEWADWDIAPAKAEELEFYFEHLEQTMVDIGFHKRENPRQTMARLRRLFYRIRPDQMELSILRGILTGTQHIVQSEKKLREEKNSTGM
ncbi:MAG TPA: tRNA (cytosine(32)/uridine(32)-2'-O)-methyltransferase TrmJ [Pseudomonadales bacterium]|nr:tRNA (cytosine(32)/uridine(32)-2'-O)-methyltransferase TrmJ [Pseudomonadales bacterium]